MRVLIRTEYWVCILQRFVVCCQTALLNSQQEGGAGGQILVARARKCTSPTCSPRKCSSEPRRRAGRSSRKTMTTTSTRPPTGPVRSCSAVNGDDDGLRKLRLPRRRHWRVTEEGWAMRFGSYALRVANTWAHDVHVPSGRP